MIASDFAGPFNKTHNGNKYIQVITDLYTKYMMVIPQPNKETKTASTTIVNKWCCLFGIPDTCLTDGGKEYQSKLWDATCELLDIERSKTSPYHPQCDGQSERLVRTNKQAISAYVNELQNNWDTALPQLTYAYNSSVHATTGVTPFEAMFGRKPKLPIDLIYPQMEIDRRSIASAPSDPKIKDFEEYIPKLAPDAAEHIRNMKYHLRSIGKALEKSRDTKMDKAKIRHDRKIKRELYHIGDKVLVNHPKITKGQKQGIALKYHGPFSIVGVNTNGYNYTIRKETRGARAKQVHKNNLKFYHERGQDMEIEPKYKDFGTNTEAIKERNQGPTEDSECASQSSDTYDTASEHTSEASSEDTDSDKGKKARNSKRASKQVSEQTCITTRQEQKRKTIKARNAQLAAKPKRKYIKRIIPPAPLTSRSGRVIKSSMRLTNSSAQAK